MIVFSAFVPHSPLLLESISKDRFGEVHDTVDAMAQLAARLAETKPNVLVMISSHRQSHETAFTLNLHDSYKVSLAEFGDHATTKTFSPDRELTALLRRAMRSEEMACTLESSDELDYGAGVPLLLLTQQIDAAVVPITYCGLDAKTHLAFGRIVKEVLSDTAKRVAVIASGDLSHCLTSDAPLGFKKEGRQFDDAVLEAIKQLSSSKLLTIPTEIVQASAECAYRPLLIFFGIHERMNLRPEILSYEAPFGVGYLVAQFRHALV